MCDFISCLASWATLILFLFYFVGRIITIITVKKIWKDKVIFSDKLSDNYDIVDEINDDSSNKNDFHAFLLSREGMRNIKIFSTDLSDINKGIKKEKCIYDRDFLNIDQAIQINIETGDLFPTLIIEYETMDFMKVEMNWYDNLKNGVYSELVVPRNTIKSVLYKLLK